MIETEDVFIYFPCISMNMYTYFYSIIFKLFYINTYIIFIIYTCLSLSSSLGDQKMIYRILMIQQFFFLAKKSKIIELWSWC